MSDWQTCFIVVALIAIAWNLGSVADQLSRVADSIDRVADAISDQPPVADEEKNP